MFASDSGQSSMGGPAPKPPATGGSGSYYAPPSGAITAAQDYTGAQDAYNRALIRYNQQRGNLLRQYGYAGDVDPSTGMVKNLRVDAGNSYGQLQQLLHNQALEDQTAQYQAEDRGIHGGLANQMASELAYGHHGQSASLVGQLLGGLGDLDNQQLDSKGALDKALWQLTHQEVQQDIGAGDFNPADVTDLSGGGDGGGANPRAAAVAKLVGSPGEIARASMAAKVAAQRSGKASPAVALAARSAGLNAAYGLTKKSAPANAYTSGKKQRG